MSENKIDNLLNIKPNMFMVNYNINEFDLRMSYPVSAEKRCLSVEEKIRLVKLMKNDFNKFLDELINWHLGEQKITEYLVGNSDLLIPSFKKFYDRCVVFSTKKYKIYFNDKAIEKSSDIIFKLSERSKIDGFNFVRGRIRNRSAQHLYMSIGNRKEGEGRKVSFEGVEEFYNPVFPSNSVCYNAFQKDDGTYDKDDIDNILKLIDEFISIRGSFGLCKSNKTEFVAYNGGSMKIQGIDKDERIEEKVNMLLKKER